MIYKDHTARIECDAADGIFVGHLAGINDIIGFHADTVGDLVAAFREAVDDDVATCQRIGKPAEKSYSEEVLRTAADAAVTG